MSKCPVCDQKDIRSFLKRDQVPVHQHLVYRNETSARNALRADLNMVVCTHCGFIFNCRYDPSKLEYGQGYDNSQLHSPLFNEYLDKLARDLVINKGVTGSIIVEIGCGQGQFLRKLVDFPGAANTAHGYDPSYSGPLAECNGALSFHAQFYHADKRFEAADVVISRHVIEHIQKPVEFLQNIRDTLQGGVGTRLFLETPCARWLLKKKVIWDFFYEHCSLFSAESMTTALGRAGLEMTVVDHVFGGQYLWIEAALGENESTTMFPGDIVELAENFQRNEARWRERWTKRIRKLTRQGGLGIWGAGAKGVTFANLFDPLRDAFKCVVDVNPNKQGGFLPGTGHPIVDVRALPELGVENVILLNSNYRDEIEEMITKTNILANLIDGSEE